MQDLINIEKTESMMQQQKTDLSALAEYTAQFLDIYGSQRLMGKPFCDITGTGTGHEKLSGLLAATGYPGDPENFSKAVGAILDKATGESLRLNGIELPHFFAVALLEYLHPGHGYIDIKTLPQLETVTGAPIPENHKPGLREVIDRYPVRLSKHVIRQARVSRYIACQYLPFTGELDSKGFVNTWVGPRQEGIVEQMYPNRAIFLLNMSCPVYCRFCFRKHKAIRSEKNPGIPEVRNAIEYVRQSPLVKEILITGGDPFLNKACLTAAIDGLMNVEHVQTLRLATRSIAYYPELFSQKDAAYLDFLKQKNLELRQHGKRMEVATHFIHPDEVSFQSLEIITELVGSGIPVYVQTPLLGGCNDSGPFLSRLFALLQGAGAGIYYIFMPCHPIHGNDTYRTTISDGLNVGRYLRDHLSDRAVPKMCTATSLGKIDWHTSGWAVEPVDQKPGFIWIRTPYTLSYFKSFVRLDETESFRVNPEGTIDIQFMTDIGDPALFCGPRSSIRSGQPAHATGRDQIASPARLTSEDVGSPSIVPTGITGLRRLHETRVEIKLPTGNEAVEYIRNDDRITDVVLTSETDPIRTLSRLRQQVRALEDMDHVTLVRIRSMAFHDSPEWYTPEVIRTLADLNRLSVIHPLRIEIETWFLTASEIRPVHEKLADRLIRKGITVYCNCPLLSGINDTPEDICGLTYALRKAGIEFHHLYTAGLSIQDRFNNSHPPVPGTIIDIASAVRRNASGREIPKYIVSTHSGEKDYTRIHSL